MGGFAPKKVEKLTDEQRKLVEANYQSNIQKGD